MTNSIIVSFSPVYDMMLTQAFNVLGRMLSQEEKRAVYIAFNSLIIFVLEHRNSLDDYYSAVNMLINDETLHPDAYVSARNAAEQAYLEINRILSQSIPFFGTKVCTKLKYKQINYTDYILEVHQQ